MSALLSTRGTDGGCIWGARDASCTSPAVIGAAALALGSVLVGTWQVVCLLVTLQTCS